MARSRNIKPGFFKNEDLGAVPREARLLFIGLWTLADREGRLEDRPARITAEVFPYDRDITIGKVDEWLQSLNDCPERFIVRYSSGKTKYLQISNFVKHQSPHVKEQASTIPAPDMPGASPVQAPDMPDLGSDISQPGQCVAPPDSLNPSSLNPEKELAPQAAPISSVPKIDAVEVWFNSEFWPSWVKRTKDRPEAALAAARSKAKTVAIRSQIMAAVASVKSIRLAEEPEYRTAARTWLKEGHWKSTTTETPAESNAGLFSNYPAPPKYERPADCIDDWDGK